MRFSYFLSVMLISVANVAVAADSAPAATDEPELTTQEKLDLKPELKENATNYVNGRNLSEFLKDAKDPVAALAEIAKATDGEYAQELTKNYVAYEEATGGRDLSSSPEYSKYIDESRVEQLGEFYGLNGANVNNQGIPYTADTTLSLVDEYIPSAVAKHPEIADKIRKQGLTSTDDVIIDNKKLESLSKRTGLDQQTIKFILKGMGSGKVTSPALIKAVPTVEDGASNFVRQNFANELAEAKTIKARSDGYFAAYQKDMEDYDKFVENMKSEEFKAQFREYAKYYKPEQEEQAMAPYVAQAQARLDKAKENYNQSLNELKNLQTYLDKLQKQKIEPAIKDSMQNKRTSFFFAPNKGFPRFSASGIYGFAASALAGTGATPSASIDTYNVTSAFASELATSDLNTSVNGTGNGFDVGITNFGKNSSGATTSVSEVSTVNDTSTIAKTDTNKALRLAFRAASESGSDLELPGKALSRRVLETDMISGDNYKPLCNGSDVGMTGSQTPPTRNSSSDCVERMHRITPFGAKTSDYMSLVKATDGTGAKDSSAKVGLQVTPSNNNSYAKLMELEDKTASTFLKNRANDSVVLTKSELNADQLSQLDGLKNKSGYNVGSTSMDTYAFESGNSSGSPSSTSGRASARASASSSGTKEFEKFNPMFDNDKKQSEQQAVEQGVCMMVEDPNGEYSISPNPDYVSTYDPYSDPNFNPKTETRHKKYNLGSGKRASIVKITNPEHPFSPRHKAEWIEQANTLYSYCSGGGQKLTTTCGTDKKSELNNVYAWQIIGGGNSYSAGPMQDRGEYKKPIVDHKGKILATPIGLGIYTTAGYAAWYACTVATEGMYNQLCCDFGEHAGCQIGILPPVKMDNKFPLTYTKAHAQSGDKDLPTGLDNAYDSYSAKGFESNGYNVMTSKPDRNFGYNMPSFESTATGQVGFGEVKDEDREQLAQYMLSIVGVNPNYSPGEDNNKKAANQSCGTGGWKALVRYYKNCGRITGVNCLCDPKTFQKGSAWGYIEERKSAVGYSVDNAERSEIVTEDVNGQKLSRSKDTTKRLNWRSQTLTSMNGKPMYSSYNYPLGKDKKTTFPNKDTQRGLSNAKQDTYIVWQDPVGDELKNPEKTFGQYKRPWMAAWVERVNPTTGCLTVSAKSSPTIFVDACGNYSDTHNKVSTWGICPPNAANISNYNYPGGMPDCAKNNEYKDCRETQQGWDSWLVSNPFSNQSAIPTKTGGLM